MIILNIILLTLLADSLPVKSPKDVGMTSVQLNKIKYVVTKGMNYGAFPGASVIVGHNGAIVSKIDVGTINRGASNHTDPLNTIYDLASVTKVVATTAAIMYLYDRNKILLTDPVQKYLSDFTGKWKDLVTIQQLLTHTSGLPAGRNLSHSKSIESSKELIVSTKLICKPGICYNYSDLSMVILGMVIEKITDTPLDKFVKDSIFKPLGMNSTFYLPPSSMDSRIAPTDVNIGKVSDPISRSLGGVSGNAGLFSDGNDLALFSQMMLNKGELFGVRIYKPETVELFTTLQTHDRALGWQICHGSYGCGGLGTSAYGHTGYTGTSIWIDPKTDTFIIVLTNRLNKPKTSHAENIVANIRNDISDLVEGALDMTTTLPKLRIDYLSYQWKRIIHKRKKKHDRKHK